MKIIIVMTYFQRQHQLAVTLKSIARTAFKDIEVVIVDDCSDTPPETGLYDFPIHVLTTKNKRWIDGTPAYNTGIQEALRLGADIILLQNAETYHYGDVISYASRVTDETYISFGCYNLSKEWTFRSHDLSWIIAHFGGHAVNNDDCAWLNHKTIRRMGYHWGSAITAKNMLLLNGFDERMCDGYCFEDDEFLARVVMLNLRVEITDFPFVVHQWHNRNYVPKDWNKLYQLNRSIFDTIRREGNPYAVHKFTPDFAV